MRKRKWRENLSPQARAVLAEQERRRYWMPCRGKHTQPTAQHVISPSVINPYRPESAQAAAVRSAGAMPGWEISKTLGQVTLHKAGLSPLKPGKEHCFHEHCWRGNSLGNPFAMGHDGKDESLREVACDCFEILLSLDRTNPNELLPALARKTLNVLAKLVGLVIHPHCEEERVIAMNEIVENIVAGQDMVLYCSCGCDPEMERCHVDHIAAHALVLAIEQKRVQGMLAAFLEHT